MSQIVTLGMVGTSFIGGLLIASADHICDIGVGDAMVKITVMANDPCNKKLSTERSRVFY